MTMMTTKTVSAATATSLDNGPSAHGLVVKVGRAREPAIRDGAERCGMTLADYTRMLIDMGLAAASAMETFKGVDVSDVQPSLKIETKPAEPKPESDAGRRRRISASVEAALLAFARKYHVADGFPPITFCNDKRLRALGVSADATGDEVGGVLAAIARGARVTDSVIVERVGDIPNEDSRERAGYRVSVKG